MKNILHIIVYSICIFLVLYTLACKKDTHKQFCNIERVTYQEIDYVSAQVTYSEKYKRYGLSFKINNSQNIDSQITGFVCNLDNNFKTIGTIVTISGTLKYFNTNENMTPEIGGQSLYYLVLKNIYK